MRGYDRDYGAGRRRFTPRHEGGERGYARRGRTEQQDRFGERTANPTATGGYHPMHYGKDYIYSHAEMNEDRARREHAWRKGYEIGPDRYGNDVGMRRHYGGRGYGAEYGPTYQRGWNARETRQDFYSNRRFGRNRNRLM